MCIIKDIDEATKKVAIIYWAITICQSLWNKLVHPFQIEMEDDGHSINDKLTIQSKQYKVNSNKQDEWHMDKLLQSFIGGRSHF